MIDGVEGLVKQLVLGYRYDLAQALILQTRNIGKPTNILYGIYWTYRLQNDYERGYRYGVKL